MTARTRDTGHVSSAARDGEQGDTYITLVAVVGWLVLHPTLITNLLPGGHQLLSQDLDVLDGLHQAVSDGSR